MQEPLHLPFYDQVIEIVANAHSTQFVAYHSTFPVYFSPRKKGVLQEALAFTFLEDPLKKTEAGLQLSETYTNHRILQIMNFLKKHLGENFSLSMRRAKRVDDTFHSPVIAITFRIGTVIPSRSFPASFSRAIQPLEIITPDILVELCKNSIDAKKHRLMCDSNHFEPVVLPDMPDLPLGPSYATFYLHFPVHTADFEKFVAYDQKDDRKNAFKKFETLYRNKSSSSDPQFNFNSNNRFYWQH
jgi:hypothetical protein